MSDIVRYYKEYYREQTIRSFENLFTCMINYDFSSYHEDMRKVFAMHQHVICKGDVQVLRSGGSSSGTRTEYCFGPNFDPIRHLIEGLLRLSHRKTLLIAGAEGLETPRILDSPNPPQYDSQIIGDWESKDSLDFLFETIRHLYSESGPVNLCALPCLWLSLMCDPNFMGMAESRTEEINALVNTDNVSCFKETKCNTRDQMIDWCSGVNFYTCNSGGRHFLPTFFSLSPTQCQSLINLKRNSRGCDDVVILEQSASVCRCGAPNVGMKFVPHRRNYPLGFDGQYMDSKGIVDKLPERTKCFQVLQREDGVCSIFCYPSDDFLDFSSIIGHLEELGLGEIEVDHSRYFSVGRKRPLLWRGGSPQFHSRR